MCRIGNRPASSAVLYASGVRQAREPSHVRPMRDTGIRLRPVGASRRPAGRAARAREPCAGNSPPGQPPLSAAGAAGSPLAIRAAHLLHLSGEEQASPGSNCRELRTGQREWADGVALKDERPPVIGITVDSAPTASSGTSTTTSPGCALVHGPGRAEIAFCAAATSA